MKIVTTAAVSVVVATITLGSAHAQGPNPPGIKLDHYQCYRLSPVVRFSGDRSTPSRPAILGHYDHGQYAGRLPAKYTKMVMKSYSRILDFRSDWHRSEGRGI